MKTKTKCLILGTVAVVWVANVLTAQTYEPHMVQIVVGSFLIGVVGQTWWSAAEKEATRG